jgi:hypothetical protein
MIVCLLHLPADTAVSGWERATAVNDIERRPKAFNGRALTSVFAVSAGQGLVRGNVDTEAVAQRASTAPNGVKVQDNAGGVEGDKLSFVEGERFLVTEVRTARHVRDRGRGNFLRDGGGLGARRAEFGGGRHSFWNEEVWSNRLQPGESWAFDIGAVECAACTLRLPSGAVFDGAQDEHVGVGPAALMVRMG